MLRELSLHNVGPASCMDMELAPRLNVLTGDNGLGKSFLLDIAWWALTRRWPYEVNRSMTSGFAARPRDANLPATISYAGDGVTSVARYEATYSASEEAWIGERGRPWVPGLVVYAHADGAFSVWDPARNARLRPADGQSDERRRAYVLTNAQVWDGFRERREGRSIPVCNGLLVDWANWIHADNGNGGNGNARAMANALRALTATGAEDPLEPGPLTRVSMDDAREMPTIVTPYAEAVPILHASAGVRRAVALAYILVWAWSEHRLAATRYGETTVGSVILLFDEAESHLHPRWQRSILGALKDLGETLFGGVELQLLVSTHSPLVLASAEPWFDADRDAWFDVDLAGDPPSPRLERRRFMGCGSVGHWLTSEAFDLATDRGNLQAEEAILRARALLREPEPQATEIRAADQALVSARLPDIDPFWVRWRAFVERSLGS